MKFLDDYRMRLVLIGVVAAIILDAGNATADFIFGAPTNLGPTVNRSTDQWDVCISSDGLTLLWGSSDRGYGKQDIWMATRIDVNQPWSKATNLGAPINTPYGETDPSLSTNGLTLFFRSNRPGGFGGEDLWVTKRADKESEWDAPTNLGPQVNTEWDEGKPSISSNGLSLYFSECWWTEIEPRPGGQGGSDIWVTTRVSKDDPWEPPVNLGPIINSPTIDGGPCISADDLALFFFSERPGGLGYFDLWVATRQTPHDAWKQPLNLGTNVNTSEDDKDPCISADGSMLYFDGGWNSMEIYQSQIIPIINFNGDGIVDSADMCIMIDNWGTDDPLCDIGPMPWGDGIVDVQDLIVLAEHLFEEFPPVEPIE